MAETLAKPNQCTPWQATLFTEPPDNETLKAGTRCVDSTDIDTKNEVKHGKHTSVIE